MLKRLNELNAQELTLLLKLLGGNIEANLPEGPSPTGKTYFVLLLADNNVGVQYVTNVRNKDGVNKDELSKILRAVLGRLDDPRGAIAPN